MVQLNYDNSNFILKGPFVFLFAIILLFFKLQNHTDLCSEFGTFIAILLGIVLAPEDSRTVYPVNRQLRYVTSHLVLPLMAYKT